MLSYERTVTAPAKVSPLSTVDPFLAKNVTSKFPSSVFLMPLNSMSLFSNKTALMRRGIKDDFKHHSLAKYSGTCLLPAHKSQLARDQTVQWNLSIVVTACL